MNVPIHEAFIIPPPPPLNLPCVELPVSGLKLEASHAEKRSGVLDSIRSSGGYGTIPLKHVPPSEQHFPGQPPPSSLANKPVPKGAKVDLMGDLNAALLKRKMGGGKIGRGGMKMGHTMRMLGAGSAANQVVRKKEEPKKPEEVDDGSTDF